MRALRFDAESATARRQFRYCLEKIGQEALAAGCWPAPEVAENVDREELGALGLSDAEEDIVVFLKTLFDGF